MAGPRRPMARNLAVVQGTVGPDGKSKGGKHWTKEEIERRQAQELTLPKPKAIKAPKWLDPEAKKLFSHYAKLLLAFPEGIVSELDAGTLARYCDCEQSYAEASAQKTAWLDRCRVLRQQYLEESNRKGRRAGDNSPLFEGDWNDLDADEAYGKARKQVDYWSGQMARFEKICRGCAADMGLTVTSRCRLVVPQVELAPETDPLEALRNQFLGSSGDQTGT